MFLAGTPGTLPVGAAQDPFVGPVRAVSGNHRPGWGTARCGAVEGPCGAFVAGFQEGGFYSGVYQFSGV